METSNLQPGNSCSAWMNIWQPPLVSQPTGCVSMLCGSPLEVVVPFRVCIMKGNVWFNLVAVLKHFVLEQKAFEYLTVTMSFHFFPPFLFLFDLHHSTLLPLNNYFALNDNFPFLPFPSLPLSRVPSFTPLVPTLSLFISVFPHSSLCHPHLNPLQLPCSSYVQWRSPTRWPKWWWLSSSTKRPASASTPS